MLATASAGQTSGLIASGEAVLVLRLVDIPWLLEVRGALLGTGSLCR